MDQRRRVRIARRLQASPAELSKGAVDIIRQNDNHGSEHAVVTGEGELIAAAAECDDVPFSRVIIGVGALEVENAGVKRDRCPHVAAAHHRIQRHVASEVQDVLRWRLTQE